MNIEYQIPNIKKDEALQTQNRRGAFIFSILSPVFCILSSVLLLSGCNHGINKKMLLDQIELLAKQKSELSSRIEQTESENEQLKTQVQVLSGLPEEVRLSKLYKLKTVKIGRLTNLYDTDKDGKYENLIVYIQPIDEEGDRIKVTGSVDVQLWDLNKSDGEALISQWRVEPDELKKHWIELLVINYRLTFDLAGKIDNYQEPLTVKVKFTDYLTGRVFNEQKEIKPK